MIRPPTIEQAQLISIIVDRVSATVDYKTESFSWGTLEEKREAYAFIKQLGGKPPNKTCFACWIQGLDFLRTRIGLEGMGRPASEEKAQHRMRICRECPAYHPSTRSCGRFILDAIAPIGVKIDGVMVDPCGCSMPLKTALKHAHCPAGKW